MERAFTFDDMTFVARARSVGGTLQVGIYDSAGECLLASEVPSGAPAAAGKGGAKTAGNTTSKGGKSVANKSVANKTAAGKVTANKRKGGAAPEDTAITQLIEQFKAKVENGEIDLA